MSYPHAPHIVSNEYMYACVDIEWDAEDGVMTQEACMSHEACMRGRGCRHEGWRHEGWRHEAAMRCRQKGKHMNGEDGLTCCCQDSECGLYTYLRRRPSHPTMHAAL